MDERIFFILFGLVVGLSFGTSLPTVRRRSTLIGVLVFGLTVLTFQIRERHDIVGGGLTVAAFVVAAFVGWVLGKKEFVFPPPSVWLPGLFGLLLLATALWLWKRYGSEALAFLLIIPVGTAGLLSLGWSGVGLLRWLNVALGGDDGV